MGTSQDRNADLKKTEKAVEILKSNPQESQEPHLELLKAKLEKLKTQSQ